MIFGTLCRTCICCMYLVCIYIPHSYSVRTTSLSCWYARLLAHACTPLLPPTAPPSPDLSAVTLAHPPPPLRRPLRRQFLLSLFSHHQAELRRAKELQGHTDLEALSRDSSPFQAALRQKHLSQLRSPKGGFSGYKDWADDDNKSDMMSRASFTSISTLPPSPPPARSPRKSALPPRCPPKGAPKGSKGGVSRRSRQPCAVRERAANPGFASACPPAAEGLVG